MRVCTLFSGYDSQCLALRRLGIDFELVAWSDIDTYAIKAHNALFPEYADRNLGDVAKVDWNSVPDFDLLTYSSPCQDFSLAGLQRGGEQGSGTRSSLLWEVEKAISTKRPKYCVMENVSALVSQKFIKLFNRWQLTLERYGYANYAKVLNAKDYGVPQNRERIFLVSLREGCYSFPEPKKMDIRLKDILETNVPQKMYLSEDRIKGLIVADSNKEPKCQCVASLPLAQLNESTRRVYHPDGISPTLCSVANNAITKIIEPKLLGWSRDEKGKIVNHHPVEVANTVTAKKGKDTQNFVVEPPTVKIRQATKEGSIECKVGGVFDASYPNSKLRRGRVQDGGETVPTLMASNSQQVCHIENDFRVRKLTPRECFRLMGVDDTDIDTLFNSGLSNTRLYVLAGNSIVVDVLVAIFDKLLIHNTQHNTLF